MDNRGEIKNLPRAKQLRNFSLLRWGNITPTDIDGFIDFQNKAFVIFEFKVENTEILRGQSLAIERLVDNLENSGKSAIGIIAEHNIPPWEDIEASQCKVTMLRYKKKWTLYPKKQYTLKYIIDYFLKSNLIEYPIYAPPEFSTNEQLTDKEIEEISIKIDEIADR